MDASKQTADPATVETKISESEDKEICLSASDDEVLSQEENKQLIEEPPSALRTERPQTVGKYRAVRDSVKDYAEKMYLKHQAIVEKRWRKYSRVKEIELKREEGDLPEMAKKAKLNKTLADLGYEESERSGNCCRAAILKGFYKVEKEEDLDQVILECKMPDYICNHRVTVRLRDVLNQIDYAGLDYEDGRSNASVFCDKYQSEDEDSKTNGEVCTEGRVYVSNICCGKPVLDNGKSHNHCTECTNFGRCIFDYRNTHCYQCGHHYFGGFACYFPCNFCSEPKKWKSKDMINDLTRLMVLVAGLTGEEMPDEFSDYGEDSNAGDEWGI